MKKQVWDQIKNITCDELINALLKDGWERDVTSGAVQVYIHRSKNRRVTIHRHPKGTYKPNLLNALIKAIGWSEKDLKRLKLIK